jgi:hypothetical protein
MCVRVSERVGVRMRVRAFNLAYPACNSYAPYCDVILDHLAAPYFSTFSHKRHDFFGGGGERLLNVKCVFSFLSTILFETFLNVRRI